MSTWDKSINRKAQLEQAKAEVRRLERLISSEMVAEGDPNNLLDAVIEILNLKNDAELGRALDVYPPTVSKIRHRKIDITAPMMVRMHEATGLSVRELKRLMLAKA